MRWQLSLKDAFALLTIFSVVVAIGANYWAHPENLPEILDPNPIPQGTIEGLLTGVGLCLFYLALRLDARKGRLLERMAIVVVGLVAAWFAGVDYSRHADWCPICDKHTWIESVRIYRWPVWSRHAAHENRISDIAADLGAPCQHDFRREQYLRFWGLVHPYPAVCGICCLSGDSKYADLRPHVLEMARENPGIGAEFHRKAIVEHDPAYIRTFNAELRARRERQVTVGKADE